MRKLMRTVHFRPYRRGMGPTFTLRLYDGWKVDSRGRSAVAYTLSMREGRKRTLLFQGTEFYPSPLHSVDGNETVAALMGFLTLRPGDTDPEYFEDYTANQHEFCQNHAETLSSEVYSRFPED